MSQIANKSGGQGSPRSEGSPDVTFTSVRTRCPGLGDNFATTNQTDLPSKSWCNLQDRFKNLLLWRLWWFS